MEIRPLVRPSICTSFVILILLVSAAGAGEGRTLSVSQMEVYNRLTHILIAPCCWREPIAIHRSSEALQMLDEVEQFVAEGRSEEEIKAIYVARYGVRILADPPGSQGHWLYMLPLVLFCGSVLVVVVRLRSFVSRVPPPNSCAPPELVALVRREAGDE